MIEIKDNTYKGTRILLGNEKRDLINKMINILKAENYTEISIPIIQHQETFKSKVGEENQNMMFNFKDRGDRDLCLAPEYTAVIQQLSNVYFKYKKDVKLFYIQECFRGERPQAGRYRQFTQLGVEILNPTEDYLKSSTSELIWMARELVKCIPNYSYSDNPYTVHYGVTRGLDYYEQGKGFEITMKYKTDEGERDLQLVGGGSYEGGVGFAIGVDRLLII